MIYANVNKTLKEIGILVGGDVAGDENAVITGVASIEGACKGCITFIASPKYIKSLSSTQASAIIVPPDIKCPEGKNIIYVKNPYLAFAKVLSIFHPPQSWSRGVHPAAYIHSSAEIGSDVSIYPNVFVDEGVEIGDRVVLYPGVYIGKNARIDDDTVIYSNVSVREGCCVGRRVIVHCNSVIGSDGFGFAKDGVKYHKIPQVGIVRIGDDVEIGACVAIDRATLGETIIKRGTKIDNLVHIAHNVEVGEDCIILAEAGVAGSTKIGNRVTLAGQVGVVGHIEIGDDVTIGSQSGVVHDITEREVFSGMPAIPHRDWLRAQNIFAKLPEMRKRLLELENKINKIESESEGVKGAKS